VDDYGNTYHTGGIITAHRGMFLGRRPMPRLLPGEIDVRALLGEGILSKDKGMPNVGGAAMLDALNSGSVNLPEMLSAFAETSTALSGGTTKTAGSGDVYNVQVYANDDAGGRRAARGFMEEFSRHKHDMTPQIIDSILRINPDGSRDKLRKGLR
jgi:hypothetical protein